MAVDINLDPERAATEAEVDSLADAAEDLAIPPPASPEETTGPQETTTARPEEVAKSQEKAAEQAAEIAKKINLSPEQVEETIVKSAAQTAIKAGLPVEDAVRAAATVAAKVAKEDCADAKEGKAQTTR